MGPSGRPAVVLGCGVTALAVLRSLGRAGVKASTIATRPDIVCSSRWYRPLSADVDAPAGDAVLDRLESNLGERPVLYACDDHWLVAVARWCEQRTETLAVTPPLRTLEQLVDKERLLALLDRLQLPHPTTLSLGDASPADFARDLERGSQWFFKPCDSQRFSQDFGHKAVAVGDDLTAVEQAQAEGLRFVVQEYVPGPAQAHVFLDGYVTRRGQVAGCLARRRLRAHPARFGNSTLTETIALDDAGNALPDLLRLFAEIEFRGLFDAEFTFDRRDGEYKLIEINARPWWQLALAQAVGLDFVRALYDDLLDRPVALPDRYPIGHRWVNPLPDLAAWMTSGSYRPLPLLSWRGATTTIYSRDDPLPALAALANGASRFFQRAHSKYRRSETGPGSIA